MQRSGTAQPPHAPSVGDSTDTTKSHYFRRFGPLLLVICGVYLWMCSTRTAKDETRPVLSGRIAASEVPLYLGVNFEKVFLPLLDEKLPINEGVLQSLNERGYRVFLCSNLMRTGALQQYRHHGGSAGSFGFPGVYSGGNVVYDEKGNAIYRRPFTKSFLQKFVDVFAHIVHQNQVMFQTEHSTLVLPRFRDVHGMTDVVGLQGDVEVMPARELPSQDIFIIYLSVHFSGSIRLSSEFTQQYATQHLGSGVYALYPPDTDKAQGLMKLMEHYNVGPQSVGYLGYDESDAMALMYCECSVTVVPSPTMLPSNTSKRASHGPYMSDTPLFSKYIIQEGFDYPTFAAAMKHIFGDTATPLDPSGTQHKA